jgi:hypothetical protein
MQAILLVIITKQAIVSLTVVCMIGQQQWVFRQAAIQIFALA